MTKVYKILGFFLQVQWANTGWTVTSYYGSKRKSYFQLFKETSIDGINLYGIILSSLLITISRN